MSILEERASQIHTAAVQMKGTAERLRNLPKVNGLVVMTPEFVSTLAALMDDTAEIFDDFALCLEE